MKKSYLPALIIRCLSSYFARQSFISKALIGMLAVFLSGIAGSESLKANGVGPMVGTVTTSSAHLLYRPGAVEETLILVVSEVDGEVIAEATGRSKAENDHVAKFHVEGLQADTVYHYRIERYVGDERVIVVGGDSDHRFRTSMPQEKRGVVTGGFVSCANDSSESVWEEMIRLGVDRVFFMGDTPYVDRVDVRELQPAREQHRHFLSTPNMARLIRSRPTAATWDDHDFGRNNSNGVFINIDGNRSANALQSFREYRAHAQFGNGSEGVYHADCMGVLQVFLLDPRYFSQKTPSPVNSEHPTSFGLDQWEWIRQELKESQATFKVLAMGQVWQRKKNRENDDMFTYYVERDALLDFVREAQIPGVVTLGGDIHVSRHLLQPRRIGYDLHHFISSPGHSGVIPALNIPHPDLKWSSLEPRQFLTLTADTLGPEPVLTARFVRDTGEIQHEVVIPYSQLVFAEGEGLGRGLRGWWDFEGNFDNKSALGKHLNAAAHNGSAVSLGTGVRGGSAASFERSKQSYVHVAGRALNENSTAHTYALWFKPTSLPQHGSNERYFLLESSRKSVARENELDTMALSLGIRATKDPSKVNIELHTHTLQPAVPNTTRTTRPVETARGPFPYLVERSLLLGEWNHVAVTFHGDRMSLYLNGQFAVAHPLPVWGGISETSELIIGGHREGVGRNFDGLIDEIGLWARILDPAEILSLSNSDEPLVIDTELMPQIRGL
jgi:alkaline phosphatase D